MREKIVVLSLFVLSIVFIALFFVATPTFITQQGDVKHFADSDIEFDMDKTWTVYEYDDLLKTPFLSTTPSSIILNPVDSSQYSYYNGSFDDLAPEGTVLNTSTTNATDVAIVKTEITKYDSLDEGVTLEEAYKMNSLYSLMNSSGQFDLNEVSPLTVDGKTAYQFHYAVSYVSYHDTWIESNGHYIRILSQSPNTFYENAKPQFDFIISTLKVKF